MCLPGLTSRIWRRSLTTSTMKPTGPRDCMRTGGCTPYPATTPRKATCRQPVGSDGTQHVNGAHTGLCRHGATASLHALDMFQPIIMCPFLWFQISRHSLHSLVIMLPNPFSLYWILMRVTVVHPPLVPSWHQYLITASIFIMTQHTWTHISSRLTGLSLVSYKHVWFLTAFALV